MRVGQGGWEEESTVDVGRVDLIFICGFFQVQSW